MKEFELVINELYLSYIARFEVVEREIDDPVKRLEVVLDISRNAIADFNSKTSAFFPLTEADEITFFKQVKPRFLSLLIYEEEKAYLDRNRPNDLFEAVIIYYQKELEAINRFFMRHRFFYEYYRCGMSELDKEYFKIHSNDSGGKDNNSFTKGLIASMPVDYLFARFIGLEKLQKMLVFRSQQPIGQSIVQESNLIEPMIWTGEVINLVELTYGLWLTGQLNHGNASLNQIVKWLEVNLKVNIGIIQRRFSEIERRKRLSPTKFIDQMKEFIDRKIEDGNQ